jgi:hypothetical protein
MEPEIDLEQFGKLRLEAKEYYDNVGHVFCPAIRGDIIFNSDGFHHLRYDSSRSERSKIVQRNKFSFLKDAVRILEKSSTVQEYRRSLRPFGNSDKGGLRKAKTVEWFGFLAVISFSKCLRINVVVRRVGEGNFHFWSVMPFWTLSNNRRVVGSKRMEDR